jgi:hypothetical protein
VQAGDCIVLSIPSEACPADNDTIVTGPGNDVIIAWSGADSRQGFHRVRRCEVIH